MIHFAHQWLQNRPLAAVGLVVALFAGCASSGKVSVKSGAATASTESGETIEESSPAVVVIYEEPEL